MGKWSDKGFLIGKQYLFVDDNPDVSGISLEYIAEEGGKYDIVRSIDEARKFLAKKDYDGLVCDATVRSKDDGVAFLKELSHGNNNMRLILLSGQAQENFKFPENGRD